MSLFVIGPGQSTANRKPDVLWKFDGHQEGYAVGIGSNVIQYWRVVTMGPQRMEQKHQYQDNDPLPYNYAMPAKKIGVCVKKADGSWFTGNLPITSIQRLSAGNYPTVRVTLSQPHNLSPGAMVFINGASQYHDGMFIVSAVHGTGSFSYVYSYGPFTSGSSASSNTGACYIASTIAVNVYAALEKYVDIIESKNTLYEDGDGVLRTATFGVLADYARRLIVTEKPHNLRRGDAVQFYTGPNSMDRVKGLNTVHKVINQNEFVVYETSYRSGTATGGYFIDFGLEDYHYATKVEDLSSHSIKIESLGSFYPEKGVLILRRDSLSNDTSWGFLSYDAYMPLGTSVSVRARASNDLETLNSQGLDNGWSDVMYSGDYIELSGRYIDLEVTLRTNDPTKTPVLKALHVAYQLRGSQEDLNRTVTFDDFSFGASNVTYVNNTAPILYQQKTSAGLAVQNTVTTYASSGELVILHDSGGLNNWTSITLNGLLQSVPTGTPPKIEVRYRFFNKMKLRNLTDWSSATSFTDQSGDMTVALNTEGKRYGEFKITFYPSSAGTATPTLNSVKIDWQKVVEGAARYLYTTSMFIPSQLSSIIIAGRDSEIDGTEIIYGVSYKTSAGKFEDDYYIVDERELVELAYSDENETGNIRIAVKLYSASTTGVPELRGFGYQMNLSDGSKFLPNLEEI
ncbi:MAG: hypothetical protein QXX57_00305 [Nitrososphaerota archaeon]